MSDSAPASGRPVPPAGREPAPSVHGSVFVRLVAVMLAMAASLLTLVGSFFLFTVRPGVGASVQHLLQEHARVIAETAPDATKVREMAARLDLEVRYEGPDGAWATSEGLPAPADVRTGRTDEERDYVQAERPGGGAYVFASNLRRPMQEAHGRLVWLLLGLMVTVVLVAHAVLRRALRPLRWLHEGVGRLAEGDLEVAVPRRTNDEFGVLTDAFNRMVGRVKEMIRARDQLLLDVSHELRSPLTRMKVALALVPEDVRTRQLLADVGEMESMIAELLELERLRVGRGIRRDPVDLAQALRETAAAFAGTAPRVHVASAPAEMVVLADDDRVRTVLRNLVENAVKYSLPDSGPVELSAAWEGDRAVVRVEDDGPGIPEADVPGLFEPFFRVDRSRSRKTGGYGLGLSLCKRIMAAHGGTIALASPRDSGGPRPGACFRLEFPANGPRDTD